MNLSGRPMSTIIMSDANTIAETAMISAIRVSGVLHFTLASRKMAVMSEPTRLIATKIQNWKYKFPRKHNPACWSLQGHILTGDSKHMPQQDIALPGCRSRSFRVSRIFAAASRGLSVRLNRQLYFPRLSKFSGSFFHFQDPTDRENSCSQEVSSILWAWCQGLPLACNRLCLLSIR